MRLIRVRQAPRAISGRLQLAHEFERARVGLNEYVSVGSSRLVGCDAAQELCQGSQVGIASDESGLILVKAWEVGQPYFAAPRRWPYSSRFHRLSPSLGNAYEHAS